MDVLTIRLYNDFECNLSHIKYNVKRKINDQKETNHESRKQDKPDRTNVDYVASSKIETNTKSSDQVLRYGENRLRGARRVIL